MSAPPRTRITCGGNPVTPGATVYSLLFVLIIEGIVPGAPAPQVLNDSNSLALVGYARKIRRTFKRPEALFRRIGEPVFPVVDAHFLLGWRAHSYHIATADERPHPPVGWRPASYCRDARRCSGVLTRCFGTLYLPGRAPDFSWERLLSEPIAFDEPLYPTP
jgi:hypothetical protein